MVGVCFGEGEQSVEEWARTHTHTLKLTLIYQQQLQRSDEFLGGEQGQRQADNSQKEAHSIKSTGGVCFQVK